MAAASTLDRTPRTEQQEGLHWVPLEPKIDGVSDEVRVTRTLVQYGFRAIAKGGRHESYDLEVLEAPVHWPDELGPSPGKYEVKRLSGGGKRSWDPRFKTSGARGSRIYGRHGALLKAAALELEGDEQLWHHMHEQGVHVEFGLMLQDAFSDRHGRRFRAAFNEVCYDMVGAGLLWVDRYLQSPITSEQIVSAYSDLAGIFIIRGPNYCCIKRDQIPQHIGFDSFGCEGLKLRLLGCGKDRNGRSGKVERVGETV